MVNSMLYPVSGILGKDVTGRLANRSNDSNSFERLTQIVRENERLLERLNLLGQRLRRARAYANDTAANPSLATLLVDHARVQYGAVLAAVRANRAESLSILRACGQIGVIEDQ